MKCSVVSKSGTNCPNTAIHPVDAGDGKVWLCERCFENVRMGVYGKNFREATQTAVPTCQHESSIGMEYHGNVILAECTSGCGQTLVIVTDDEGISHQFTVAQLLALNAVKNAAMDLLNHRHLVRHGVFLVTSPKLRQWEAELEAALSEALDRTVVYTAVSQEG